MAVAATGRLQTTQKHGRVWRHLHRWRGHLVFVRVLVEVVVLVVITDFDDSSLHVLPLHEALVVKDGGFAIDDVLLFAVRVGTCRMVIH